MSIVSELPLISAASGGVTDENSLGLKFVQTYAAAGWKVIAGVRKPSTMPEVKGDVKAYTLASDSLTDAGEVCSLLSALEPADIRSPKPSQRRVLSSTLSSPMQVSHWPKRPSWLMWILRSSLRLSMSM